MVRDYGADATAAVGVGFRVIQAAILPIVAVGAAVASLSGQNYGARDTGRVKAAVLWGCLYTGVLMSLSYAALAIWPEFWISLFSDRQAVIAIGADYLILSGISLPLHGMGYMVTSMAQGLGRNIYPMMAQGFRLLGFLAALAVLDGYFGLGLIGVFWSNTAAYGFEMVSMSIALALLWHGVLRPLEPRKTAPDPA